MSVTGANALEEIELDLLLEGVYQYFGDDFRGFERARLKRRLFALMEGAGLQTVSALQDRVLHDRGAGQALLRALSLRPVALFDDAALARALRAALGPWLRSCAAPKAWVAECTCAEEVFTLAILLEEEGLYDKTLIYATGPNEALLREAEEGTFALESLAQYERNYLRGGGRRALSDYCAERGGRMVFLARLRRNITWAQYGVAGGRSFNEFQLIMCRKALADFSAVLRRDALRLFDESLSPFAVLNVAAGDEMEASPFAARYEVLSRGSGLYRRVG